MPQLRDWWAARDRGASPLNLAPAAEAAMRPAATPSSGVLFGTDVEAGHPLRRGEQREKPVQLVNGELSAACGLVGPVGPCAAQNRKRRRRASRLSGCACPDPRPSAERVELPASEARQGSARSRRVAAEQGLRLLYTESMCAQIATRRPRAPIPPSARERTESCAGTVGQDEREQRRGPRPPQSR